MGVSLRGLGGFKFAMVFSIKISTTDYVGHMAPPGYVYIDVYIQLYSCIVYQSIHAAYASLASTKELSVNGTAGSQDHLHRVVQQAHAVLRLIEVRVRAIRMQWL